MIMMTSLILLMLLMLLLRFDCGIGDVDDGYSYTTDLDCSTIDSNFCFATIAVYTCIFRLAWRCSGCLVLFEF